MKTLLRSCFIAAPKDSKQFLLRNFLALQESGLEFDVQEDTVIWNFVLEFVRAHNHVPDVSTLQSHFTLRGEPTVVERAMGLSIIPVRTEGDFLNYLEGKAKERRTRQVIELLKESGSIVQNGLEIREGKNKVKLLGPTDAVRHFLSRSHDIVSPTLGARLSGEVTRDGEDFAAEYDRIKMDPLAGIGQHTGLHQMDLALNGAKRYELWIHAAFTGHGKSSLMLNWAYNQAVHYQHSSLIFSLEMPYQQCRRILYAIHSSHDKFKDVRFKLGLQKHPSEVQGLNYADIRDGSLEKQHVNAEKFLLEYVIPDLNGTCHPDLVGAIDPNLGEPWPDPADYGKIYIEVADPDKSDFSMADLRQKAELIYTQTPYRTIFVDHFGLMAPRKWTDSTTERLNEIVRDAKRLAMSFNRGQGIAVVGLFQMNRDGYKNALKRKEKGGEATFDLTSLSYANECLISGTYVALDHGHVPIEQVAVGDQVWSRSGWKEVLDVFDQGIQPVWRVLTDRGSILEATGKHRIQMLHDERIQWREISSLKAGDWALGVKERKEYPKKSPALPKSIDGNFPAALTDDLAYLLGAWDGDGRVRPYQIGFTGNRKERKVLDRLVKSLEKVFGVTPYVYEHLSRKGSFDMEMPGDGSTLKGWFEGISGVRGQCVPEIILKAQQSQIINYLRGLFDTDGWVNKVGIVGLKMKVSSLPLLLQVQMLLLDLGIDSILESPSVSKLKITGKSYSCVTLRVRSRQGRAHYAQKIGFSEPSKQKFLLAFVRSKQNSNRRGCTQMYPVPKAFLRAWGLFHPPGTPEKGLRCGLRFAPNVARRTGLVSQGSLESLLELARQKNIWSPDFEFLQELLLLQVSRVNSVESTNENGHFYDLEVGGDHEYQTGAFLSHNCERSADIVTASWLDKDLINKMQFQCLKSRDQKPFELFVARVEWPCRRLLTSLEATLSQSQKDAVGDEIDKATKKLDE